MGIYVLATGLSVLFARLSMKTRSYQLEKRDLSMVAASLPLLLISAVRYGAGTDYYGYINIFNNIKNGGNGGSANEFAFVWMNRLIARLGGDYRWMIVLTSVIFMWFICSQIYKDSPYPDLSIFLLVGTTYYFASYNGIRQMCGAAILLFSIRYIEKQDFWRFALFVALATGFHATSLAFLALYFMKNYRMTPSLMFPLTILIYVFSNPLTRIINYILSFTRYSGYAEAGGDGVRRWIAFAVQLAVILLASWQYQNTPIYRTYYNSQMISLWISAFDDKISWVRRMQWTFGLATVILVPLAIKNIKDRRVRSLATMGVVIAYGLHVYYVVFRIGKHDVLPYKTFLKFFQ